MGIMLQLEEALAEELRREASDENTSVEELAHRLVQDALNERLAARRWQSLNRRRLELIAQKLQGTLATPEIEELDQLQSLAYERAAPFDKALLSTAVWEKH